MRASKQRATLNLWLKQLLMRSPLNEQEQHAIEGLPCEVVDIAANRDFVGLGEARRHAHLVAEGLVGRFAQTSPAIWPTSRLC